MVNRNGKRCGTCNYHCHEDVDDGWVCVNSDSDYCTDWTDDDFGCEKWEGRAANGKEEPAAPV